MLRLGAQPPTDTQIRPRLRSLPKRAFAFGLRLAVILAQPPFSPELKANAQDSLIGTIGRIPLRFHLHVIVVA